MRNQIKLSKNSQAQQGRKASLVFFLACLCIFVLFAGKQSYGITTLKFGVFAPQDHPWSDGVKLLQDQIAVTSKGQIKIEIVPLAEIGGPDAFLSKVRDASIDMGLLSAYYLSDIVHAMRIFKLPFAFRDKVQAKIATSGVLAKELLNELEAQKLIGLEFVPFEYRVMVQANQPIIKPEDFKGLKVATVSDPMMAEAFKALGAGTVFLPFAEARIGLERGLVSAAEGTPSVLLKMKSYEVAKYMTVLPIHYIPGIIIASPKTWAVISPDHKNLINRAIPPTVEAIDKMVDHRSESAIKMMRKMGVAVYYPRVILPFRKAVLGVYKDAAKKIPAKYWQVAYNCAYVKRDLKVCSRPDKATVLYRRWGDEDKPYNKYQSLTETEIELEYAVWQIRVEKEKYWPEEDYFNPHTNPRWRIDFELKSIQ